MAMKAIKAPIRICVLLPNLFSRLLLLLFTPSIIWIRWKALNFENLLHANGFGSVALEKYHVKMPYIYNQSVPSTLEISGRSLKEAQ